MLQSGPAPALVSIHDVMPQTLQPVSELLDECRLAGIDAVTLLVVPGLPWTDEQLGQLRQWQAEGYVFAGHGWVHRAAAVRSLYHWLHSKLLSRDVAEHLSLSTEEIVALVGRCADWFCQQRLEQPALYVPPAWAVGPLPADARRRLPFDMLETLRGVSLLASGRNLRLPLVGFEADTALRSGFLRCWNAWTIERSRARKEILRISLHPRDHRLRLARQLRRTLAMGWSCRTYASLNESTAPA